MNLNPTPPSIDVYPGDPFVDDAGAGFTDLDGSVYFTVRARVSTADSYAGQELLLAFMDSGGPLSVQAALAADDTLNGLASQVVVEGPTGTRCSSTAVRRVRCSAAPGASNY
jgi:hypothetical protein